MSPATDAMNLDQPSRHVAVDEVLSVILAIQAAPRGGAAALYFAGNGFGQDGDLARAKLCGQASMATLRLERAIRTEDYGQQRAALGMIGQLREQWDRMKQVDIACDIASQAAA